MTVFIDFETRSDCDIKECGAAVYSEHPTTDILCLYYAVDDKPVQGFLPTGLSHLQFVFNEVSKALNLDNVRDVIGPVDGMPEWVAKEIWKRGHRIVAHNVFFEKAIWRNVCVKRLGWPDIPDNCWECSAATASALALPRGLGDLCEALDTPVKKDETGKRTMLQISKPRRASKANPDKFFTAAKYPEKFRIVYEYCYDDVGAERDACRKMWPLSSNERQVWLLDQKINWRGVHIDTRTAYNAKHIAREFSEELNKRLVDVTEGELTNTNQVAKVLEYLVGRNCKLDNLQAGTVEEALKKRNLDPRAKAVLETRKALSKASTKKLNKMLNAVCADGTAKDILMYHGASTGRVSGKGIQLQNLIRGSLSEFVKAGYCKDEDELVEDINKGDWKFLEKKYGGRVLDAIATSIRSLVVPPPGHKFICADYSAIEARVIMWESGQEDALQTFRDQDSGIGEDIYKVMAGFIYQKDPSQVIDSERFLGKSAILGCGFGMGPPKFKASCEGQGVDLSEAMAKKAVYGYRDKYHMVPELWRSTEHAAVQAVISGNTTVVDNTPGVQFEIRGDFLFMRLPSKRALAYYKPKILSVENRWKGQKEPRLTFMGVNSVTRKWERQDTYGGKLVENMTQAIARDIMVDAMERAEEAGYTVAFTVHDELICQVPESRKDLTVEGLCGIMGQVPEWAAGLPINAEGWEGNRYAKR